MDTPAPATRTDATLIQGRLLALHGQGVCAGGGGPPPWTPSPPPPAQASPRGGAHSPCNSSTGGARRPAPQAMTQRLQRRGKQGTEDARNTAAHVKDKALLAHDWAQREHEHTGRARQSFPLFAPPLWFSHANLGTTVIHP